MIKLALFLVLISLSSAAFALTEGEIAALQSIHNGWPRLANKSPPWTSNISAACAGEGFYGLRCSEDHEHVIEILFDDPDLYGALDSSLGGLLWLQRLTLYQVTLRSQLPSTIETLSSSLLYLNVSLPTQTNLLLTFIPELTSLAKLEVLALGSVQGTLPSNIGDLQSLRHFEIVDSPLYGRIPSSFALLEKLETVIFRSLSSLSGFARDAPVQHSFPNLITLRVSLCANWVSTLPQWLSNAHALRNLELSHVNFRSDIAILANFPNLTQLTLQYSSIYGTIGPYFWNLPLLESIRLEADEAISLSFGPPITGLSNMTSMRFLSSFGVTGTLPASIARMTSLRALEFFGCSLSGTIPASIGALPELRLLILSEVDLTGTIPASIGSLSRLVTLSIENTQLSGSLPSSMTRLTALAHLSILKNALGGTIPNIPFTAYCQRAIIHGNLFTGPVPSILARNCRYIDLASNRLGPNLDLPATPSGDTASSSRPSDLVDIKTEYHIEPQSQPTHSDLFAENDGLEGLLLNDNLFECGLPLIPPKVQIGEFHSNQFIGEVPASYCQLTHWSLRNNQLTNATAFMACASPTIDLHNNSLQGTIPLLSNLVTSVDLSYNKLTGSMPDMPQNMTSFIASYNQLSGKLTQSFLVSAYNSSIFNLALDSNALECPESVNGRPETSLSLLFYSRITHLSLANNNFRCFLLPIPDLSSPLINLDLSNNQFMGGFEIDPLPSLVALNLAKNLFSAKLFSTQNSARYLGTLDVSENHFSFPLSTFLTRRYYLTFANMSHNSFNGGLRLTSMTRLQIADFTNTHLSLQPNLASIGEHFTQHRLQLLSISNNSQIAPFNVQDVLLSGLNLTEKTSPTDFMSNAAFCYQMAFEGQSFLRTFLYDQSLFNYEQCHCDSAHFGHVSLGFCFACPLAISSSDLKLAKCGGDSLVVPRSMFIYDTSESMHLNHSLAEWRPTLRLESCPRDSCKGLHFVASDWSSMDPIIFKTILDSQCAPGSGGRLCSRCACDPSSPKTDCYFSRGSNCVKCSRTFPLGSSIALASCFILAVTIIVSIIMTISLRSKRTRKTTNWTELALGKRIFYRLLHLTSLGNVSILVTFLQLLITLTNWDSYVLGGILGSLNGSPEGIGLRCLFPILAHPMAALLLKLLIPIVAVLILGVSVIIAALVSRILDRQNSARPASLHEESDLDSTSLLGAHALKNRLEYPATALFTSVALSVVKFFYLGTALAAHEYLFSSTQDGSATKYVQNHPWMKYEDALPLIGVSIPWLIVFDFVLPILFVILCWKVRKTFKTPEVSIYFGTFFETFSTRCFWWEMVNILKKLAIALIVQGIADSSALQSAFAVSILAATLLVQSSLNPWKRPIENIFDGLSALVLIGATITTRSTHATDDFSVRVLFFALSVLFVLLSSAVIAYETYTEPTAYELQTVSQPFIINRSDSDQDANLDNWKELSTSPNTLADGLLLD